jgi:hypothetical protein
VPFVPIILVYIIPIVNLIVASNPRRGLKESGSNIDVSTADKIDNLLKREQENVRIFDLVFCIPDAMRQKRSAGGCASFGHRRVKLRSP